ncbi:hypothetical protein B0T19DRAFT_424684 [Cercophora scortea]|uniref:Uncharacterized protein n=1 Tax=Cercophora scortea TaxID=314031 RepID=A0AAE0MDQ7_9PEZI|nr:hypothetical protein B0T19DRAFT_424684 [Cercophora scortea]
MRIAKPRSANNSPRSAMLQSRRRTLIGENLQGRFHSQPANTSYLPTPPYEQPNELSQEREQKPARPVSWHPSTQHLVHPTAYPQQSPMDYPYAAYSDVEMFSNYQQLPPTPTTYSGYTSPASAFSPLSLPYSNAEPQQYLPPASRTYPTQQAPVYDPTVQSTHCVVGRVSEIPYQQAPQVVGGSLDWRSFASGSGFDRCTAPPTPEYFTQSQQPEAKLATEESIPYQPLEDEDEDCEILYGMGLYDAPDKSIEDPHLDLHRSTIFSLLGGAAVYPEPTGKGLKLEDAWEPPASDDEDDSKDGDDDAEGEEQD